MTRIGGGADTAWRRYPLCSALPLTTRPDRVGLESGARRRGLDAIAPRSGAGMSKYYEEFIPTAVADLHAMAMPAPAEKFTDVVSQKLTLKPRKPEGTTYDPFP